MARGNSEAIEAKTRGQPQASSSQRLTRDVDFLCFGRLRSGRWDLTDASNARVHFKLKQPRERAAKQRNYDLCAHEQWLWPVSPLSRPNLRPEQQQFIIVRQFATCVTVLPPRLSRRQLHIHTSKSASKRATRTSDQNLELRNDISPGATRLSPLVMASPRSSLFLPGIFPLRVLKFRRRLWLTGQRRKPEVERVAVLRVVPVGQLLG